MPNLKKTQTIEQQRTTCVALWLRRYSQTFRMYGKTLEDFPDRFEAFTSALSEFTPDQLYAGFERCLKTLSDFPVPAEVRAGCEWAIQERQFAENHQRVLLERAKEDEVKSQRFNAPIGPYEIPKFHQQTREEQEEERERLRQEFQDMLDKHQLQTFDSRGEVRAGRKRPKWVQEFLDSKREPGSDDE